MLQTPLKQNTNVHFHSTNTSALKTDDKKTHFRKQEKLRTIVKRELRNATFEASWVPDTFCPADPTVVTRVLDLLKKQQVFTTTLGGEQVVLTNWPAPGAGERQFYAPFIQKLNAIIDAFKALYPNQYARSFFAGTRFYVYDRSMLGSVDGEAALKPDLLASKATLDGGLRIYWYHAMLAGEVRLSWPELVAQAATYARCMFAATEHHVFIPILCLNHAEGSFRLCLYHRGGLLASTAMNLKTIVGFHLFVSTIVGLWQWDSLKKAGCEPSMSHSHISFNDCQYRITAILCRRQAIRARATSVFVVQKDETPADEGIKTRSQVRDNMARVLLLNDKKLEPWSRLSPFDDLIPFPPSVTKHIAPIQFPDTFIVKCSHQPDGRHKEEDVFHSVQGFIGIPEILGGYEAEQFNIPTEHTAVKWDIISHDKVGLDSDDSDDSGGYGSDAEENTVAADEVEDLENLVVPIEYKTDDGSDDNDDKRGSGSYVDHHEDSDHTADGNSDGNEGVGSVEDDSNHEDDAAIQEVKPHQNHTIEIRRHRHLIIKTVGRRLELVDGPRTLARAIQHAIIVGSYLHRDVSNGNIVVLPKPIDGCKIPPILSSTVQSNQCIAVLIDGDVAKEWGSGEQASHRSGTLPFISAQVADRWLVGLPPSHTPIDDLESFVWVLLYELLRWTAKRTKREKAWWKQMNAVRLDIAALSKHATLSMWADPELYKQIKLSSILRPFRKLLHKLFASAASFEKEMRTTSEADLIDLFNRAYIQFVRILEGHIPLLPTTFTLRRDSKDKGVSKGLKKGKKGI
ncbi:hypothetical protein PLEOSDRAFT_161560 [Pleurotus ostreatus PC15]|uniref:Fungal-type protein kinase domain-containing protein n=1 Tax=Pleurotus ostreatus (strain PC15) TaxID=1137138 RepID=A0A067NLC7_PLEO1|nr:hypothetical protein PLEOSDRAFT_161560 [Pleurotus ostreatus PC15]